MDQLLAKLNQNNQIKVVVNHEVLRDARECLIGAIDQGTSSSRFLVFAKSGQLAASAQMEHTQIFPEGEDKVGWHEHDPIELWQNTAACIDAVVKNLRWVANLKNSPIKAVGVTNQRETTVAWNDLTGVPYYNAIVWDDVRTTHLAREIANGNVDRLRNRTGLPLASYFAGTKVKWLLDNVEQLRKDLEDPEQRSHVRFGTIDTW
jgi:glycerol kinase